MGFFCGPYWLILGASGQVSPTSRTLLTHDNAGRDDFTGDKWNDLLWLAIVDWNTILLIRNRVALRLFHLTLLLPFVYQKSLWPALLFGTQFPLSNQVL